MRLVVLLIFSCLLLIPVHSQVLVQRGPYVQVATQNSIIIKWRTNTATSSRVIYGLDPVNLIYTVSEAPSTTDHEVQLTGLLADTKYYYSIGNATDIISAAPDQFFFTLPPTNTIRPYNFWVIGDCGSANDDQRAVRNSFQNQFGPNRNYGIIMLGDNAYTFGTDGDYQDAIFNNMYEDIISNTVMWPTPGNHDYYSGASASSQTGPYYDIFSMPTAGQLGGVPSNTEAYYSYNIGNIHFISIDSYDSGRDSNNTMGNWIKQDLMNNTQEWTIAYWHHPAYTKGSHDSDNPFPWLDFELPQIREQIIPIMERYGVDLILNGHSHSYERSYLLDGHYGNSSTFNASHQIDDGSGDFVTDCPYIKNTEGGEAHKGTVYALVGVSGKTDVTSSGWPHPAMYTSSVDHLGSMLLTVNGNRLDAKFLTSTEVIYDQFSIIKNAGGKQTVHVCQGQPVTLKPSFPTNQYNWMPGNINAPSLNINPFFNSFYFGSDPLGCIKDTFQIQIIHPGDVNDTCNWSANLLSDENIPYTIHPNPARMGATLQMHLNPIFATTAQVEWIDPLGRSLNVQSINSGLQTIQIPENANPGIHFLKIYFNHQVHTEKIIITD
jgi:acid phosphatase type 7